MKIDKHLPELRRAIRNNKHEFTESGLVVPSMGLFAGFACESTVNGADPQLTHNLLTLEGRRYLIAAAVNDAVRKVEQNSQEKMSGMTAGMQLPPGFKMPF